MMILLLYATYFALNRSDSLPYFNISKARAFIDINQWFYAYTSIFSTIWLDYTRVLDNSANEYILIDKYLFLSNIKPYLIGIDISTVIETTLLVRIDTTRIT